MLAEMPTSWNSFSRCHSMFSLRILVHDLNLKRRGFDTEVGGKGSQLSGGQKRKLRPAMSKPD